MQQTNIPIASLIDMYKRKELALPAIQRRYVWEATKVRDLLDSLYRGYPSDFSQIVPKFKSQPFGSISNPC